MDTTSPTSGLRKMARAQVIPSWLHRPSRMAGGRADCILPATTSSSARTRTHGASVSTTVPQTTVSHWRQLRVLMLTDSPSQHRKWYREFERRLQLRTNPWTKTERCCSICKITTLRRRSSSSAPASCPGLTPSSPSTWPGMRSPRTPGHTP